MAWLNSMAALMSSDELAKDVSSAEALLEAQQVQHTSVGVALACGCTYNGYVHMCSRIYVHTYVSIEYSMYVHMYICQCMVYVHMYVRMSV